MVPPEVAAHVKVCKLKLKRKHGGRICSAKDSNESGVRILNLHATKSHSNAVPLHDNDLDSVYVSLARGKGRNKNR